MDVVRPIDSAAVATDEVTLVPPTTVCPPQPLAGARACRDMAASLGCLVLAQRLLKVRYRKASVGVVWALIQPILLMVAFTIFFGLFARLPSEGVPYPLFFFSGLVAWQITAKLLSEGSARSSPTRSSSRASIFRAFISRLRSPSRAWSTCSSAHRAAVSDALLRLPARAAGPRAAAHLRHHLRGQPGPRTVVLGSQRRVPRCGVIVPFFIQVGFFVSPIIYPASIVPAQFQPLYYLNPFALGIEAFRWATLNTPAPPWFAWVIGTVVAVVLLVSGYIFFRQREGTFADVI